MGACRTPAKFAAARARHSKFRARSAHTTIPVIAHGPLISRYCAARRGSCVCVCVCVTFICFAAGLRYFVRKATKWRALGITYNDGPAPVAVSRVARARRRVVRTRMSCVHALFRRCVPDKCEFCGEKSTEQFQAPPTCSAAPAERHSVRVIRDIDLE